MLSPYTHSSLSLSIPSKNGGLGQLSSDKSGVCSASLPSGKDVSLHFDVFRAALISHPGLRFRQHGIASRVTVSDIHRAVDLDCRVAHKLHLEEPRGRGVSACGRRRDCDSNDCFPLVLSKHELKRRKTSDEYSYAGLDYAPVDRGRNANYFTVSVVIQ